MAVYFCERCKCNHVLGRHCPKDEPLIVEDEIVDDYEMLWKDPLRAMYDESWILYKTGLIVIAAILSAGLAGYYFFG